jgi:hypothetical protein
MCFDAKKILTLNTVLYEQWSYDLSSRGELTKTNDSTCIVTNKSLLHIVTGTIKKSPLYYTLTMERERWFYFDSQRVVCECLWKLTRCEDLKSWKIHEKLWSTIALKYVMQMDLKRVLTESLSMHLMIRVGNIKIDNKKILNLPARWKK